MATSYQKKPWQRASGNSVNTRTTSSPTCGTRIRSRSHPVLHFDSYRSQTTASSANPTLFSSMSSVFLPKFDVCYNNAHTTSNCPLLPRDTCIRIAMDCSQNRNWTTDARSRNSIKRSFNRSRRSHEGYNNNHNNGTIHTPSLFSCKTRASQPKPRPAPGQKH